MPTRTTGAFRVTVAACLVTTAWLVTAGVSRAQTPYVPYYGKNQVHYGNFDWQVYKTDHFEIFYYADVQKHLERVAGYAESAYQQVSSDLKHDLAFKVPLILFKTHVEFEQQNVIPGAAQEGVAAFAEPSRNRMLLPLDEPPDLLYRTITHELTHIFEFDIIPQSLIRREEPLWINEGLSDFETGYWSPLDLSTVRDAAVSDIVPKMSELQGYGEFTNPRLIYNLGHAAFEFMESRWGKEGIRQFLFSLRKSVIGGGEGAYDEAFKLKADEFDQAFEKYLKDRFKPFRDKERPLDYGRNLAPNPEKTRYSNALTAEPSPSGDLIAIVTGNRKDQEYDIVLISSKDGQVVRNLTPGFDQNMGFQYLSIPGTRWNTVSWLGWSPVGDRLVYAVRFGKDKGLAIQDVVSRKILQRINLPTVNEPESPCFSPDGKKVVFSALQNAKSDLFMVDLESSQVTNVTNDAFYNYAPVYSPDGKSLIYLARVSGNEKLFRFDLDTKKRTQITFGTHDDAAARFVDTDTIVFASTATDPAQTIDPEVARNGNIYNLWTLNLKNGELRQFTDSLGGNVSPVVVKDAKGSKVAFITYYKGEWGLHTADLNKPLKSAATADFGAPGPIIDFQAPLSHTLVAENNRKKKTFEKMFLDGRPPLAVGVTSNGDVFGGTQLSMSDVLGDHRVDLTLSSIMQYATFAASYTDLSHRFQWAAQGLYQKQFYYGNSSYYIDPYLQNYISRNDAVATQTLIGGSLFGIYPLDTFRRVEVSAGLFRISQGYNNADTQALTDLIPSQGTLSYSGALMPLSASFIQETTVFREFGPLAGNTVKLTYEYAPAIGPLLGRSSIDADLRYYQRVGGTGVAAIRLKGFKGMGESPSYTYFGGMADMRGYDYGEFVGNNALYVNAEMRFPIIHAALTPIGMMGGVRGVLFFDIGGAWYNGTSFTFSTSKSETVQQALGYTLDSSGNLQPVNGPATNISGFRLRDARASYGVGVETFVFGLPLHFDWAWRTTFNTAWEDYVYGSSADFRKPKFQFWIGYDW